MTTPATQFPKVGETTPDFTLNSLGGESISLSSYKGRKLIIFMWASW